MVEVEGEEEGEQIEVVDLVVVEEGEVEEIILEEMNRWDLELVTFNIKLNL